MSEQQTHPARRKVLISITVVVALIFVSSLSILFLQRYAPRQADSQNANNAQPEVTTSATITKGYAQLDAMTQQVTFGSQGDTDATSSFVHTLVGYDYRMYISAKDFAQFTLKAKDTAIDTNQIAEITQSFLMKFGLVRVEAVPTPAEGILDETFVGDEFICHLGSTGDRTYALACVATQELKTDYETTTQLVKLYVAALPSAGVPMYDMATLTERQDGNKQSAIISLSESGTVQQSRLLLFAAIDGAWEYIVDLDINSSDKGKYAPTPAVEAKLQNPKYGDFLVKQLQ